MNKEQIKAIFAGHGFGAEIHPKGVRVFLSNRKVYAMEINAVLYKAALVLSVRGLEDGSSLVEVA